MFSASRVCEQGAFQTWCPAGVAAEGEGVPIVTPRHVVTGCLASPPGLGPQRLLMEAQCVRLMGAQLLQPACLFCPGAWSTPSWKSGAAGNTNATSNCFSPDPGCLVGTKSTTLSPCCLPLFSRESCWDPVPIRGRRLTPSHCPPRAACPRDRGCYLSPPAAEE